MKGLVFIMKNKIKVVSLISSIVAVTAVAAITVTTMAIKPVNPEPFKQESDSPSNLSVKSINTSSVRNDVKKEITERKQEIVKELKNAQPNIDEKELNFESNSRLSQEFAFGIADILKNHNKLDNNFTISDINDDYKVIEMVCGILNDKNAITEFSEKEQMKFQIYLEEHYYYIQDDEPTGRLRELVENTINIQSKVSNLNTD